MKDIDIKQTEIGEIPTDWDVAKLENVLEKVIDNRGKTPPLSNVPTRYEVIEVNALVGDSKIPNFDVINKFVTKETFETWFRDGHPDIGDILFSTVGSIAEMAILKEKRGCIAQNLIALRTRKNIVDSDFLYYFLKNPVVKAKLMGLDISSVQPSIKVPHLLQTLIFYPSISEQCAIAKILSDLDGKIELNNQMNKTLESIGQAIFKRWFVDFEFPDRNGKPYKSSGGKMVESGSGKIPEGWSVKEISDCGEVICGKTPPTADKENYGDDIFFITIPDMRNQAFVIKTERQLSKQGASIQKNKELPPLTICVSCIATPGLVSITSDISHTNQQINSIVCKKDVSPYFMYYTMLDKSEEIKTMGLGGTATLNLNTGNFARIKVIIPDRITMDTFHKKIAPIMSRLLSNLQENIKLYKIRDSLLPRLMSGRMRIN